MADVTATFGSLSTTESSNNPVGGTSIGTGLDDNLRMIQALMAAWRDATGWGTINLTSVSGTNTVTATLASSGSVTFGPTALSTGMRFRLIPANSNTGAATLNITSPNGGSALGAKNIYLNGAALVGYELRANCPVIVDYDGTQFNIIAGAHGGDGVPIGSVKAFAGTTTPNGFLLCYGQAISRTTYADLFAVLSTTYGTGDGSTTFNVPDLRGRVVAGQDDMGGSSANRLTGITGSLNGDTLGATGGEEGHALTSAENGPHTHGPGGGDHFIDTTSGGGGSGFGAGTDAISRDAVTASSGSGDAHNNVQPTIILNYGVKY